MKPKLVKTIIKRRGKIQREEYHEGCDDLSFRQYSDGSIEYSSPQTRFLERAGEHRFALPPDPRPRTETFEAWIARIERDIMAQVEKLEPEHIKARIYSRIGNQSGGFFIHATEGHRALMCRAPKVHGTSSPTVADFTEAAYKSKREILLQPEFHLAVKRALIMTTTRADSARVVTLKVRHGQLILTSEDPGCGSFEEIIVSPEKIPWNGLICDLNGEFLESALGVWPLRLMWDAKNGHEKHITFADVEGRARLAIMPIRLI